MPKHQQRARKTPYARPAPQRERQGIFSRIKNFLWGQPQPTTLGAPQIVSHDNHEDENSSRLQTDDSKLDVDTSSDEDSRITHSNIDPNGSINASASDFQPRQGSEPAENINLASNASQLGPNEALSRFFEEKGDADLSNMEVMGVLSLIGQAVCQNESLVDFSNLSSTVSNNTTTQIDQTPSNASILRGLHVPPSPRPYMRNTPPPVTSARSQGSSATRSSPWTSPRPSRISARHSIGYGNNGRPTPRLSNAPSLQKPTQTQQLMPQLPHQNAAQPAQRPSYARSETPRDAKVTPAASAILRALDDTPSQRVLSREAREKPETSTPSRAAEAYAPGKDTPLPKPAGESTKSSATATQATTQATTPFAFKGNQNDTADTAEEHATDSDITVLPKKSDETPAFKWPQPPASSSSFNNFANSKPTQQPVQQDIDLARETSDENGNENEHQKDENQLTDEPIEKFEFWIPSASGSKQMTPAEEEIVARSQSEFTF